MKILTFDFIKRYTNDSHYCKINVEHGILLKDDKNISEIINDYKTLNCDLQNKKLYRHKSIKLPRDKFNILKEKHNCSITRDYKNADYIIFPKNMNDYECLYKYTFFDYESNINFIEKMIDEWSFNRDIISRYSNEPVKLIGINIGYNLKNYDFKLEELVNRSNYSNFYKTDVYNLEILNSAIKNKNILIDSDINDMCTEDSIIIDLEQYYNLENMIENGNRQDLNLILELLANSNFEKSKSLICCLYYFYSSRFKDKCSNWNSINIKTFRLKVESYFNRNSYINISSVQYIITKLITDDYFDDNSKILLEKKLQDAITNQIHNNLDKIIIFPENFITIVNDK
jgi:hypothetical protein